MSPTSEVSTARPTFGDLAGNALRYWEPRRLLYNLALAAVVIVHVIAGWPGTQVLLTRDHVFALFLLAVLANIAYCAAYAVDLFVQFSAARSEWPRWRWILLTIGTTFAAILTHFIMLGVTSAGD